MNQAQRQILRENFASEVAEIKSLTERLRFANAEHEVDAPTEDPAEPSYTQAQKEYLATFAGSNPLASMDDFQRSVFDRMGRPSANADASATTGQIPTPKTLRPHPPGLDLDTAKLHREHSRNLEFKLNVDEAYKTLITERLESMRGVPPELRSNRPEVVAAARTLAGPYLM